MAQDHNIQITVTGKDDASPELKKVGKTLEEILADSKRSEADMAAALANIGSGASRAGADASAAAGGIASSLEALGITAGEVGVAISAAFAVVTAAATAVIAAVGGIALAMGDAINTAEGWGSVVHKISQVSGISTEAASTLAYIATVAGAGPAAIEQAMAMNSRILQTASDDFIAIGKATADAQKKYVDSVTSAQAAAGEKQVAMAEAHAERVSSIQQAAGASRSAFDDRMAERDADRQRQELRDVENQQQRMSDLEERHTATLLNLNQSVADAQESAAQRAEDRAARLADQLENFDGRSADRRLSIQQRVSMARDEFEKKALEGQLSDFDATAAKERQKLVDKAAEEERKAKEADDKAMRRLEARIAAEDAQYVKQLARQQAAFEKAEADKAESYVRDTARQEKAQAAQAAATGARLAAEEASYAKMADAAKKAEMDGAAKRLEDYNAQILKINEKAPGVVKALEDIGLNFDSLQKMTPDQQFFAIAKGINGIDDAHKKLDLMNKLYGRGGWRNMLEVFEVMGTKTLPEWNDAADDAYGHFDKNTTATTVKTQRELNAMKADFEGLKTQIGVELLPVVDEMLKKFQEFWKTHGPEITKFLKDAVDIGIPNFIKAIDKVGVAADGVAKSPLWKILMWLVTAGSDYTTFMTNFAESVNKVFATPANTTPGAGVFTPQGLSYNSPGASPTMTGSDGYVPTRNADGSLINPYVTTFIPPTNAPDAGGGITINQTNNYPSPPVSKDEALGFLLLTYGFGGRK